MRLNWFPWRFMVSRLARSYGFLDPIQWLNRMRGFAHPSEVAEPVELLRAGVLFHARGLINTKAIQHNLDWVWPYWVERQFNPLDASFVPRAFSFSHINLTHRNWTAVGLPDVPYFSIVDPRGLVTPFHDAWSLDFWLVGPGERRLYPSKLEDAIQFIETGDQLCVVSRLGEEDRQIETRVSLELKNEQPRCLVRITARAPAQTRLAVAIRPYNPEGISFIDNIEVGHDRREWRINDSAQILFSREPDQCYLSTYRQSDVSALIDHGEQSLIATCPVSMASGAALFEIGKLENHSLLVRVPMMNDTGKKPVLIETAPPTWNSEIAACSRMQIPDPLWQSLYDTAVSSLILHTPGEVFPGPYTYKRFWYRDAAFILNALISLGARERVRCALDLFPRGQTLPGYFLSQEGEWDSNGAVLWILHRYLQLTGEAMPEAWRLPIEKGARWILRKRLPKNISEPHAGLLPAGFSAEHLGPNDFYYWDDFWGVAGLRCAASVLEKIEPTAACEFAAEAEGFLECIVASFKHIPTRRFRGAISASPHRRMDAGAVGSLAADYPLQLFAPGDERILKTVNYLLEHSSFAGGFFQHMIHSGINAYLTLHLAQVLLRANDPRALELVDTVARLASPTGQWPEAIHPRSGGGCMGDGQHIWAAADWAMMIRNLFVREETCSLVLGSGLSPRWLEQRQPIFFGPTLTPFGPVSVRVEPNSSGEHWLTLEAQWRQRPPAIMVRLPGNPRIEKTESPNRFLIRSNA